MDFIKRLIVCLSFLPFAALSQTYSAWYSIQDTTNIFRSGTISASTLQAAAEAFQANNQNIQLNTAGCETGLNKRSITRFVINQTTVRFYYVDTTCAGTPRTEASFALGFTRSCPSGTLSGTTCTASCPAGETLDPVTRTCKGPTCTAGEELATLGDGKALNACIVGCQYEAVFYASVNSDYRWRNTGKTCDGTEVETTQDPLGPQEKEADKMCQVGTCRAKGEINGVSVDKCVPCNTVTTSGDKTSNQQTTTTNPDGSVTTKSQNSTTTSTTSCSGGNCTTTTQTTVTDSDGKQETKTETKQEDKATFCQDNPNHQLCKSTSWGGACGNYACDGDPVQCAQARAAAELLCKLDVPANSPQVTAGQQAVNGSLPGSTPESISSSVGQFNTTNPYTSSCPGDVEVNVGGLASFSIPISRACPYIELIGWVLVAGATLAGARIAFT